MLSDTTRLNGLIDNLLSASRVEQKHWRLDLQTIDFSAFVEKYFRTHQFTLPKAGKLTMAITPGIHAAIDQDAMATVLRTRETAPKVLVRGRRCACSRKNARLCCFGWIG